PSQEAEPVAQTGDREVCVYVEQVVLSWLLVFAGPGFLLVLVKIPPFLWAVQIRALFVGVMGRLQARCQGCFQPWIRENPGNNGLLTKQQHD
ncbi:Hypothetical protein SMAX5B_012505, partial [Scophthalmus maximus]